MAIFEITKESLIPLSTTSFSAQGIRERYDLQRILRAHISAIAPETYVLSEEYGEWEDSKRRIDLLCLDKQANIVVVELKRTEDGGHLDLQAIRYAAMVSTLTFAQAVEAHTNYLRRIGATEADAQELILKFLDLEEPNEQDFAQDTRIILVSGEFSKEVTTSVLWLNQRDIDIRCVRLRPYSSGDRTLLDIQQIIPLPEAAEYQVQVRKKEAEKRQSQDGPDFTRYDLIIKGKKFPNQWKRRLFLLVIRELIRRGIKLEQILEIIPERKFVKVDGQCTSDEFRAKLSVMKKLNGGPYETKRYFLDEGELIFVNGITYALSNQWSKKRLPELDQLIAKYPEAEISYSEAVGEN